MMMRRQGNTPGSEMEGKAGVERCRDVPADLAEEVKEDLKHRQNPLHMPGVVADDSDQDEHLSSISPNLCRLILQRAKNLRPRRTDQSWAAKMVNDLRDKLMNYLQHDGAQPYFRQASVLNSGSYYEMLKINNPDEFDLMLRLPTPPLTWTETAGGHGLYYSVSLTRRTRGDIQTFLLEESLAISASKILLETRSLVRKFIRTYRGPDVNMRWYLVRKRVSSPAVTLVLRKRSVAMNEEESVLENNEDESLLSVDIVPALEVSDSQAWPPATVNGLAVEKWLGKKMRNRLTSQAFYFVPKRPQGRNLSQKGKESWRISFSHIEKEIIRNHGNKKTCCERNADKCCRKQCLMLLKCLLEKLKLKHPGKLEPLCSYYGKTAFLHLLSTQAEDRTWSPSLLPQCFLQLVNHLLESARAHTLPHFFIPQYNLFAPEVYPKAALVHLHALLQEQIDLGFPILEETSFVSPGPQRAKPSPGCTSLYVRMMWRVLLVVFIIFLLYSCQ